MTIEMVVVGASLGGFDALKILLGSLPASFSSPVAVVQHQRSAGGQLAELLQRYTGLNVVEPDDKEPTRPGWVYLAPAGYHLLVERGFVALSVDPPVLHARPSIDVLFESAADVYGPRVVGVILTGTGRDGAAGLARIKQRGGIAIVQDPTTALRASMPEAALLSGPVDWTLPLEQIGDRLIRLCGTQTGSPNESAPGGRPPLSASDPPLSRI